MNYVLKIAVALLFLTALANSTGFAAKAGKRTILDPEKLAERVLKKQDANGDGAIETSEFNGKAKLFAKLDGNKDGKLDKSELQAAAEQRAKRGAGKHKKRNK